MGRCRGPLCDGDQWPVDFFFFNVKEDKSFQMLFSKDLEMGDLRLVGHQRATTCL